MYGMFTQNSPAAARDSAPGSLQNHNSPGKLVKGGQRCGIHPTLKWKVFFFIGVTQLRGPNLWLLTGWIPLCSFGEETPRQEKSSMIRLLWVKTQIFPHTHAVGSSTQIPTRCLECPEVDVDQHKVDDGRTVLFTFPRLEDVTFFQAFAVEDFRINLRERELVHACPFLSQKKLLRIHNIRGDNRMRRSSGSHSAARECVTTLKGGLVSLGRAEKSKEMMRSTPRCGRRMSG